MSHEKIALKFSVKASWAPFYINGRLLAGKIIPLYRLEEKLFNKIDDRGREFLKEYYFGNYGLYCDPEDRKLSTVDYLKKHHCINNAFVISYDKTVLVLGYNVYHYKFINTNPPAGIHVDYFSSMPLNYPDNYKPKYLGNFIGDDTYYRVRGVGAVTIALASHYAETLHPKEKPESIAVDLTARADEKLINERYVKNYGLEFYRGKRGKDNEMFLTFRKARAFFKAYEKKYKALERPEGNGLTFKDPFKY